MPIDTSQCPLCGNSNHCAINTSTNAESCWCQKQVISPSLIEQLSESQRNKACICQSCAVKAQQLSREIT